MVQNSNCEYDNEEIIEENDSLVHEYYSEKHDASYILDTYTEFTGNHKVESELITQVIEKLNYCIAGNTNIDTDELYQTSEFIDLSGNALMCEYKLVGENIETPVTSEIHSEYFESVGESSEMDRDTTGIELPYKGTHKNKQIHIEVQSRQLFEYDIYTILFRTRVL